jgi:multisubunit Na+/H+ antiporter MnhG subunit
MNKILSIIFIVIGVILGIYGFQASDSIGSSFSRLFTGTPTDKTIWLLIAGAVLVAVGLVGVLRLPKN